MRFSALKTEPVRNAGARSIGFEAESRFRLVKVSKTQWKRSTAVRPVIMSGRSEHV